MKRLNKYCGWCLVVLLAQPCLLQAQQAKHPADPLLQAFKHPPEAAKPWVFWYWMQASVSREGITADLQAMKDAGIGGTYLMTIKGPANPPLMNPPVEQLTPQWWQMIKFAMQEADRIGIKLAMHDCDGFAVAGGPWITPALSMQKVTWSKTFVTGGQTFNDTLARPQSNYNYYKDIAVYAYPLSKELQASSETIIPTVTTNKPGVDAAFLAVKGNKKGFSSDTACYIQYAFGQPFTCRSITIHTNAPNFQAQRLAIQVSDDGQNFRESIHLQPARTGWQDGDAPYTYAIPAVTAKYFRFVYNKAGTEPGAEDIDFAKWKPNFKIAGITLYSTPQLNQYEGKNGSVWRVAAATSKNEIADSLCIAKNQLINISQYMDANGKLNWPVPAGNWVILRMGHTSTGHTNETGGAGRGLECDKFNPEAIKLQFNNWFGEAVKQVGPELAARVLKIFHVDSWECGSQNWSPVFRAEFMKRRGYDPLTYLPAMAGVPVQNTDSSERFLHDVRQTIADLLVDEFYHTMTTLAHQKGCSFSAECTAPTMVSDDLLHYKEVDLPMGEFWLRSPTHDKPNDVQDAISGGHIYGKQIIQAEAYTELRLSWDEHPAMLKALGDRNLAFGINRFVLHVFMHNPWTDRKPGMTLDGIGSFFQRDQTWWQPGKAWISYLQRCQAMLQMGKPVTDIAVFTGTEIPARAILPDRLVNVLPGIMGDEVVASEAKRLANIGEPMRTMPAGVSSQANMVDPADWVDPLRGYAYDSVNPDALKGAKYDKGRIALPGGANYGLLVMPGATKMNPTGDNDLPNDLKTVVGSLVADGATVLASSASAGSKMFVKSGKGTLLQGPYRESNFNDIGIAPDFLVTDSTSGMHAKGIAWTHRAGNGFDIYFVSNQQNHTRDINASLRVAGKIPEIWDPVTGTTQIAGTWSHAKARTDLPLHLEASQSLFIVLRHPATADKKIAAAAQPIVKLLKANWKVSFNPAFGGPKGPVDFSVLSDWSKNTDPAIKYYSGTAAYTSTIDWAGTKKGAKIWLDLGAIGNVAQVTVNGVDCGVLWTAPYRVDIAKVLHAGSNQIRVEVTNTWANRLMGDNALPAEKRTTWTNAVYRLDGKPLLPAGLLGPVTIVEN